MEIRPADLTDPQVIDLIAFHQRDMVASSPAGKCFPLDLSGLSNPAVIVLAAWEADNCVAIGALRRLGNGHAELKSMRTLPGHTRRGYAQAVLEALIDLARQEGISKLSLETGSGEKFEPALALYRRRGFANGPAFAGYRLTEFNQCLHMAL